jgi:NCS1 family nucleobase:cation symporter-1
MSTTFYTGPMVSHLGGGDISWILGLIVASGLYYVLHLGVDVMPHTKSMAPSQPAEAVDSAER